MKGYSAREVFESFEMQLLEDATRLVELIPDDFPELDKLRCHELARAVGTWLNLPCTDGKYGSVEHTWLWTMRHRNGDNPGTILDVYSVARCPMVQLVDYSSCGSFAVPNRQQYQCYPFHRGDIRADVIGLLLNYWKLSCAETAPAYRW